MKTLCEIKWDDDSTQAQCTYKMCEWIHAFDARNVIWSYDLFLALCLYSEFGCHANVYLPIKLRTNNVSTHILCEENMSLHNIVRNLSISHENFSTGWIEDCQNHRQMKRSLSTSPSFPFVYFGFYYSTIYIYIVCIFTSIAHTKYFYIRAKTFLSLSSHTIHMHVN